MSFGVGCTSKSRKPQCDQQRIIPLPISVLPSSSGEVPYNLTVYVANTTNTTTPGSDAYDGLSPNRPVATVQRALEIVRQEGYNNTATISLASESSRLKRTTR